jgi:hypothetical protein
MTRDQLKDLLWQDFDFVYAGKDGSVCPFSDAISVTFDGNTQDFADIDAAMTAPMFDGKSLNEIAPEIEW